MEKVAIMVAILIPNHNQPVNIMINDQNTEIATTSLNYRTGESFLGPNQITRLARLAYSETFQCAILTYRSNWISSIDTVDAAIRNPLNYGTWYVCGTEIP